jgi:hypothetical protein
MPQFQLKTPVALILFKRPDTTERVFQAIRQAKPPQLFLIADGARGDRSGEAEQCAAARAVVEQVDWDCEVFKNYSEANLGCGTRIPTGLDWVFSQVEAAILLEDDCLPHPSFFQYCEELLDYYRHDTRIMTISGDNTPTGFTDKRRPEDSYYFSIYPRIWGWATWRRAWNLRQVGMHQGGLIREGDWLKDILQDEVAVRTWQRILRTAEEELDVWGYQWSLTSWLNSGLSVIPNVNLVSNLGFGFGASNTMDTDNLRANTPVVAMNFPLQHPAFMIADRRADRFTHDQIYDFYSLSARLRSKGQKLKAWGKRLTR